VIGDSPGLFGRCFFIAPILSVNWHFKANTPQSLATLRQTSDAFDFVALPGEIVWWPRAKKSLRFAPEAFFEVRALN
jgi:hypothetical protein